MTWLALAYSAPLILLIPAVIFLRFKRQRRHDRDRKTYLLIFPADLAEDRVIAWLRSISGTLRNGFGRIAGSPTITFETWASDTGITHRLTVPSHSGDYIAGQLRSLVPGINVQEDDSRPRPTWVSAIELGMRRPSRQLHIPNHADLAASLLASVQVQAGETVILQWVLTPAVPERPPAKDTRDNRSRSNDFSYMTALTDRRKASRDEIDDRRGKLQEQNFQGIGRIAAVARSGAQAVHLVRRVEQALAATRSSENRLLRERAALGRLIERVNNASAPLFFPAQFSIPELAAVIAWPVGSPIVAGLPQGRTRHLAATGIIPRTGRVIARSNFPGNERLLALSPAESTWHLQVVGPTGSGKTALLTNLIAQDMNAGRGVVLIESKGDLFNEALARVPERRLQDVVLLDVTDTDHPVGFNVLQGNPYAVAADIQRLFDHLYPQDARGVRVRQGFYHLILTLMMSTEASGQMTFADIGPLAVPRTNQEEFTARLVRGVSHVEELAVWWQEITNLPRGQRDLYFKPITDRIWQLNNRPSIRNIIGQSRSTVDLAGTIRGSKILFVNLGRGVEGKDTAGLVGSLLLNALWSAVRSGAADPANPTMLYLDEFQDFLNLPISPADMFAQARSLGLAMTVAHQFLGQLTRELQDATQNNARSTVVFQTSADEARHFTRQFGRSVTDEDFMNQMRFEVLMRLATSDGVSSPVTGLTLPPVDPTGFGDEARRLSRVRYGRPVAEVEAEIQRRRGGQPAPTGSTGRRRFGGPRSEE